MNLPQFAIRRPVTILMMCLIAILLGAIAFLEIPVDLMPEMVRPTLSITTVYEGVAPEEVENLVTRPLEEALSGAPGVQRITSTSAEGMSSIRVEFPYGVNIDEAANELRTRIDRRRSTLPEGIQPPIIYKFDVAQFPIMFLNIASSELDPKDLRQFVERDLQHRFERVPGVAQFDVRGGLRRQIRVALDLRKLRALNLSANQVVEMIRQENMNRPAGQVQEGQFEVLLRTQGEFQSLEQLRTVVIATRNQVPIYLRDIATIEDSHEDIRYMVSVNGEPALRLFVYKQSGANTVEVSDGVWAEVERIQRDYPHIRITATGDAADFIKKSILNLQQAALIGGALAILVLLFFLRSFSSTLIIGTAIPIAVISAFALMYFSGFTLNVISFGGLALGIGMLVDNSIVVLENIFRHRESGQPLRDAALVGSKEVATAITASTLTTVVVFVPVLFLGGMAAQTFQQLAYVVAFTLLCSLIVALSLVPMLCSKFLRSSGTRTGIVGRIYHYSGLIPNTLAAAYGRLLEKAVDHRWSVVAVVITLMIGAVYLMPFVGVELQPEVDEGEIRASVELEPGTRVEVTYAVLERMYQTIREHVPEAKFIMLEAGSSSTFRPSGQNEGRIRINLVEQSERSRTALDVVDALRPHLQAGPGVTVRASVGRNFMMRMGSSGDDDRLQVELRGYDLQTLRQLAEQVSRAMLTVDGVTAPRISVQPGMPEMLVTVDRPKAASMGLNVSEVASTLETAIGGRRASMYREGGDEFEIIVRLREEDRLSVGNIHQIPLTTPVGRTIDAKSVVSLTRQEGPNAITRSDQQRIIVVSGTLVGRDLGSVVADLDGVLSAIPRPEGYEMTYGGEYEEQQEAFRAMTFAAILALLLVYMVMASQFESLRDPFIILFSIPLAGIGIILALLITNTTMNIQGFLGIVVLVGIVVNNGIVLVDYMNILRREHGIAVHEAVILAGKRRLRPILMTTATTVLALLPMSMGVGEGAELQAPLARVVIGGLLTSTLITLFVIPIVYLILEEHSERSRSESRVALRPAPASGD